jgi:hypothetical protein
VLHKGLLFSSIQSAASATFVPRHGATINGLRGATIQASGHDKSRIRDPSLDAARTVVRRFRRGGCTPGVRFVARIDQAAPVLVLICVTLGSFTGRSTSALLRPHAAWGGRDADEVKAAERAVVEKILLFSVGIVVFRGISVVMTSPWTAAPPRPRRD